MQMDEIRRSIGYIDTVIDEIHAEETSLHSSHLILGTYARRR